MKCILKKNQKKSKESYLELRFLFIFFCKRSPSVTSCYEVNKKKAWISWETQHFNTHLSAWSQLQSHYNDCCNHGSLALSSTPTSLTGTQFNTNSPLIKISGTTFYRLASRLPGHPQHGSVEEGTRVRQTVRGSQCPCSFNLWIRNHSGGFPEPP